MDDIATALTASIAKDGQTTPTANLPMGTYRHTGVGNGSARTDYTAMGQTQDGTVNWVDGGGAADAITATYSPAITGLVDGQICFVRATAANATTTPTFSPNGLTARTIVKDGGSALVAGDIAGDGHELILRYNLAGTQWELLNPAAVAAATASTTTPGIVELATAAEVQAGTDTGRAVTPQGLMGFGNISAATWFLDEDDMISDSALRVASQQSIKAYVAAQIAALTTITAGTPLVQNPFAINTSVTQAHGLGAVPTFFKIEFECLTAQHNWSVGNKIVLGAVGPGGSSVSGQVDIALDSTNVVAYISNSSFTIVNKTTRASSTLTPGNWKMTITPYLVA